MTPAHFNIGHKAYEIHRVTCYACNAKSEGVTTHNGEVVLACKRHADPSIPAKPICYMCYRTVAKNHGNWDDLGRPVHLTCEREDAAQ